MYIYFIVVLLLAGCSPYTTNPSEDRYVTVSRDRSQISDRDEAAMFRMLELSNQNMNAAMERTQKSFQLPPQQNYQILQDPMPHYQPRQRLNCTTTAYGNVLNTNCY